MKQVKVSQTAALFFEYHFTPDNELDFSRYYFIYKSDGTRTVSGAFFALYPQGIEIVQRGNDAPRGGKSGEWVRVKYLPEFYAKWGSYLEYLADKKAEADKAAAEHRAKVEALGDQKALLANAFKANPELLRKFLRIMESNSSKVWRNRVRLEASKVIGDETFNLLTLTPADIRDIAYSVKNAQ